MNSNKNFVVLGIPRSGTKFFCKTLSDCPNIWLPSWNDTYEPFNLKKIAYTSEIFNHHFFDQDAIVKKLINSKHKQEKEYVGFKTFLIWHRDFQNIVTDNNLKIIIMIRKDFWKVFGSFLLAIDNNDYSGSSKIFMPFKFEITNREKRRIIDTFNNFCYQYWQLENVYSKHKNFIDKIYFEDLLHRDSFSNINDYFNREIIFNSTYSDKDSYSSYFDNFDVLKDFIKTHCKSAPKHYNNLPEYLKINLEL